MTIAVIVKVHDGLVLAADSATALSNPSLGHSTLQSVYFSAERIVHLHKELPLTLMTWGSGNIGNASIPTLARDLRHRFTQGRRGWSLDPNNYELRVVAERVREFFFEEKCEELREEGSPRVELGMCVAGYSSHESLPEMWEIMVEGSSCASPKLLGPPESTGISWFGQSEPIRRLVLGVSNTLRPALLAAGVKPTDVGKIVQSVKDHSEVLFAPAPMPIPDAIQLAEFLVNTAIQYSRFAPGHASIGGRVQIATITKHQGFKWIQREHYFEPALNEDVRHLSGESSGIFLLRQASQRKRKTRRTKKPGKS